MGGRDAVVIHIHRTPEGNSITVGITMTTTGGFHVGNHVLWGSQEEMDVVETVDYSGGA